MHLMYGAYVGMPGSTRRRLGRMFLLRETAGADVMYDIKKIKVRAEIKPGLSGRKKLTEYRSVKADDNIYHLNEGSVDDYENRNGK